MLRKWKTIIVEKLQENKYNFQNLKTKNKDFF